MKGSVCRSRPVLVLLLLLPAGPEAWATTYASRAGGVTPVEEQVDLRSLPTLRLAWEWSESVEEWQIDGGVAYVVAQGLLAALDVATGSEFWRYELAQDCACSKLRVLPDRVVAGIDGRAIFVDRASGALVADLRLGKSIDAISVEPLVVSFTGQLGDHGLVRLDETTGVELGRVATEGQASLEPIGDRLLVRTSAAAGATLTAFDSSLEALWQRELPKDSYWRREDDEIEISVYGRDTATYRVDLESGELLPAAPESRDQEKGVSIVSVGPGLLQVIRDQAPPLLVRSSEDGDGPEWSAELPVRVESSIEWGDQLLLTTSLVGARTLVLFADAGSGEIRDRAVGPRRLRSARVVGDTLVAEGAGGLVAVHLGSFGPPLSAEPVAAAVMSILDELKEKESLSVYDVQAELVDLGPEALPYLSEAIPGASSELLSVISRLTWQHGYRPAGPLLAERAREHLARRPEIAEEAIWEWQALAAQLSWALSAVAGLEQVAVLRAYAEHREIASGKLGLLAALGRLSPDDAAESIRALRERHESSAPWLRVPPARSWANVLHRSPSEAAALEPMVRSQEEALKSIAALVEAGEGDWIVFPDLQFGGYDFWAAHVNGRTLDGPFFAGTLELATEQVQLDAWLREDRLELAVNGGAPTRVALADLRRDGDGDGLTDLLERRLGSDPAARDTDGDGLTDAADPAPVADSAGGRTAAHGALVALHEVLALAREAESTLSYPGVLPKSDAQIVADAMMSSHYFLDDVPRLEWRAAGRATFVGVDTAAPIAASRSYRVTRSAEDEVTIEESSVHLEGFDQRVEYVMRATPRGWLLVDVVQ